MSTAHQRLTKEQRTSTKAPADRYGSGQVNWPVVLAAAEKYGVKHYFIEDESADAEHQIVKSLRYLEQVRW